MKIKQVLIDVNDFQRKVNLPVNYFISPLYIALFLFDIWFSECSK